MEMSKNVCVSLRLINMPANPHGGKDMYGKPLFVRAEWDEVARVWVATSDDVPGLATEEDNLEGLIEKLKVMIPELLDVNALFHTEVKTTFAR